MIYSKRVSGLPELRMVMNGLSVTEVHNGISREIILAINRVIGFNKRTDGQ